MSPSGRTEDVTLLRAAIARIESGRTGLPARVPHRRGMRTAGRPALPLGLPTLDALLGGGLRQGALHEIVPAEARDEGAASGFALALAARCLRRGAPLIWIVEDAAAGESGAPYRPGLQAHGLDPDRLVVVRTRSAAATLWAAEEALRTADFLVLAELWGGRRYGLVPSRRLVLAARSRGATGLLVHAGLAGGAAALSSSSETRFVVAARPSRQRPAAGGLPVPGAPCFAVRLDKIRSATRAFDRHQTWSLLWDAEQRCFHDADLPVALAAPSAHRPAPAQRAVP